MSNQTAKIYELLSELYKPHQAAKFMGSKQSLLNDEVPTDLVASGRGGEVIKALRVFLGREQP